MKNFHFGGGGVQTPWTFPRYTTKNREGTPSFGELRQDSADKIIAVRSVGTFGLIFTAISCPFHSCRTILIKKYSYERTET